MFFFSLIPLVFFIIKKNSAMTEVHTITTSTRKRILPMLQKVQEGLTDRQNTILQYQNSANQQALNDLIDQTEKDISTLDEYDAYQQRMIFLNNSARERVRLQNAVLWTFFYTVLVMAIISVIHYNASFIIGDNMYTFLETVTLLIGGIFVFYKYSEYIRRDPLNYHDLQLAAPASAGGEISKNAERLKAVQSGNISDAAKLGPTCVGAECCTPGTTIYDAEANKCKPV